MRLMIKFHVAIVCRFPLTHHKTEHIVQPNNGWYGMDTKYPRGKYPREAWPWDRPDAHGDVSTHNWAKPNLWDGVSEYSAWDAATSEYRLNTSIYELCAPVEL